MSEYPTTADLLVQQFGPTLWLSIKQVSLVIGLAEQTIHNQIAADTTSLPTRKLGRRRVVHVLDLARWIDEQRELGATMQANQVRPPNTTEGGRPQIATKKAYRQGGGKGKQGRLGKDLVQ